MSFTAGRGVRAAFLCVALLLAAAPALARCKGTGALNRMRGPCGSPDPITYFPPVANLPDVLVTNFALVIQGAQRWQYTCDDMYGRPEPRFVRRNVNGDVLIPTTKGLFVTRDGCTFTAATGAIADQVVYDVAIDARNPNLVFAIGDSPRQLFRSADGGRSFESVYTFPQGLLLTHVVLPPTRTQEMYFFYVGRGTATPILFSPDDGKTFVMRDPGTAAGGAIKTAFEFLAADPVSPQVLYFTLVEHDGDQLWRSTDGGATATSLKKLGPTDALAGLAFGATPDTLYVAANDLFPENGKPPGHLYISRDGGRTWLPPRPAPLAGPQLNCLVGSTDKLFTCGRGTRPEDVMLASSTDEGQTWAPITSLGDMRAPSACSAAQCQAVTQWLCNTYTLCPEGVMPTPDPTLPDAGSADGPVAPPDAARDLGEAATPRLPSEDSGCGCRLGGGGGPSGPLTLGALAVAALLSRRRRAARVR